MFAVYSSKVFRLSLGKNHRRNFFLKPQFHNHSRNVQWNWNELLLDPVHVMKITFILYGYIYRDDDNIIFLAMTSLSKQRSIDWVLEICKVIARNIILSSSRYIYPWLKWQYIYSILRRFVSFPWSPARLLSNLTMSKRVGAL